LLRGNHIPSPLEGEGGVRGIRPHSADTRLLEAGRFIYGRRIVPTCIQKYERLAGYAT